ncbi:MAG: CTP synthase [Candidatus Dojkabacteria bacterium]
MSKYIFVSGGVISGIGKGISAASIGVLLKSYGYKITMLKADPYLNVDAGTMNPSEHGETFVLEDGFETDMDIGSYERFVNESFSRPNSMTCGAVLEKVIKDERSLAYDGKWVSLDYHVPNEAISWIKSVAKSSKAEITIVEIGGTVGEIANGLFLEVNKIMKIEAPNDVIHVHLSYLPVPNTLGEMKSKPVQVSTQLLNTHGIHPDFLIARSEYELDRIRIEKLSRYCYVPVNHIVSAVDTDCIYDVPVNFKRANLGINILKKLNLKPKKTSIIDKWVKKTERMKKIKKEINIGIIGRSPKSGKFDLKDSYVSVLEAINHASWEKMSKPNIHWIEAEGFRSKEKLREKLLEMDAIVVLQGIGKEDMEGKIRAVEIARESKLPFLGLGYGFQIAVVEYARNVCKIKDATTQEIDSKGSLIMYRRDTTDGRRLGSYPCKVKSGSVLESLYKKYKSSLFNTQPTVLERHRNSYEFNNEYKNILEDKGLIFSSISTDRKLVEAVEIPKEKHPFFIATLYHPELKTRFILPHPIFMGFIEAAIKRSKR